MLWFLLIVVLYFIAVVQVLRADNKTRQVVVLVVWALLAMLIGHFGLGVFG